MKRDGKRRKYKMAMASAYKMDGLTLKQKRFCDHYFIHGNGGEAAIYAGYPQRSAYEIAVENLRKPLIIEYLKKNSGKSKWTLKLH
jgi:hypothetical protein